jgi:hypothetical protein
LTNFTTKFGCFGPRDSIRADVAEKFLEDNITGLFADAVACLQADSKTMGQTAGAAF